MTDVSRSTWTGTYAIWSLVADRRARAILLSCVLATLLAIGTYSVVERANRDHDDRAVLSGASRAAAEQGETRNGQPEVALYDVRDVKPLSMPEAIAINAAIPITVTSGPKAQPFTIDPTKAPLRSSALRCLTAALYYEAASESDDGQRAVAQVILNRMRHPEYPPSICGVVYQGSTRDTGCQFTFTCDGSLSRVPSASGWARSRRLAEEVLSGRVYTPVGLSTHYHANYVVPYWAASLDKTASLGRHIFYRWRGWNGTAPAFRQRYAQVEQIPTEIAAAVLPEDAPPSPMDAMVEAESLKEEQPTLPVATSKVPIDMIAPPPTTVVEDRRVRPSLLADQTAGTLKLPSAKASTARSTAQRQQLDNLCLLNRKATPVAPSGKMDASESKAISPINCT